MAAFDTDRLQMAQQLHRELAFENRLQAEQARAFVRGLQVSWKVRPIVWTSEESEMQLVNARRLMHVAEMFEELEGAESSDARDCYRRAADLLEWLTRADDPLRHIAPLDLFAAAAFQLGGLPAMAHGLLGQLDEVDAGTRLYANFLKADFDAVIEDALSFWAANPDLTDRGASTRLLSAESEQGLEWFFTVELVRCLGLIAASLRQGNDDRLQNGLKKLRALDKIATRSYGDDISLLVSMLRAVADRYDAASIYRPLRQLAEINREKAPRLLRFARDQFSRGRGILWTSQIRGLDKLLASSAFALCTPTGSGKTLVANLALVKELLLPLPEEGEPAPLALYLVPSRALAGEVEAKLASELGHDLIVTGLYGGTDWGVTDYWLKAEKPTVLIATVEKAEALMRYLGPLLVARLRLLVVDEAHQVVPSGERISDEFVEHRSRSLRLESFVSRLLVRAPGIARIALTAVAGGAAGPVARWIEGQATATPIGTNYRSTRQVVGALQSTPGRSAMISLRQMNGAPLSVRARGDEVYIPLNIPSMPQLPTALRNSIAAYNDLSVLWAALHLTNGERRVLISIAQRPELTMGRFKQALALKEWSGARWFKPPSDPRLRARFDEARATCVDYCGEDSHEVALLDAGIASNHGQMPQRLRRLMTDLIDKRVCPITLATATLTEGVNLPFDMIFVMSLRRNSFDPNAKPAERRKVTPLSTAEFRNLAGRAGRPGAAQGIEGMTLVAIPMAPSTTADGKTAEQLQQIRELKMDYESLLSALESEEQPGVAVPSPLSALLQLIAVRAAEHLGLRGSAFLAWLESAAPATISPLAGTAAHDDATKLADTLDELDGVLLSAIEEVSTDRDKLLSASEIEALLRDLWRRSFSSVAAAQEAWLELAFVRRGQGLTTTVYKNADERRRLYQYGFSPHVGRRFETIAPQIRLVLEEANDYGSMAPNERFVFFKRLGALVEKDRGFGFRVRNTDSDRALLNDWDGVLAWWMGMPGANAPLPEKLRGWQRFVSENLEFRLGVVIGAVVAQAWSDGADDALEVPSLEHWRGTTGLPWFGFWARELLRWGTLDPFVAFALAQGLAGTRAEAAVVKREFTGWMLSDGDKEAEEWINPQHFLRWMRDRQAQAADMPRRVRRIEAELSGATGELERYTVLPIERGETVHWIDPAGFEIATSDPSGLVEGSSFKDDFELSPWRGGWSVRRSFGATGTR